MFTAAHILLHMKKLAVCLLLIEALAAIRAQDPPSDNAPQIEHRITKLPPPSYPATALAAHVWGPVELSITIHQDGTVDSAEVISGPPMLRAAAVESAKRTQFECAGCAGPSRPFRVVFNYELTAANYCGEPDKSYPRISQSVGTVTIAGESAGTCDPETTVEKVRARSAKCLYLWKCSWR
jgi:TonB family protein